MFAKPAEIAIIVNDSQPNYTNGDTISGHVVLRIKPSHSPVRARIWLKCEEVASIAISDAGLGYEALANRHWYNQLLQMPGSDEFAVDLSHGEHIIPFTSQIPSEFRGLPGSYSVSPRSGIFWSIECETVSLQKPESKKNTKSHYFEMIPSVSFLNHTPRLELASTKKAIDVYFPGFANRKWQLTTKFPTFRSNQSKFHTRCVLKITEVLAQCGLQPGNPQLLDAVFSLEVSDPNATSMLFLTKIECVLKQTFTATIKKHYKHSEYRCAETTLLSLNNISWGLKEGEEKLREALSKINTPRNFPPTRTNQLINVEYELGLMVKIANKEMPNRPDKLWVNVPVVVHPRLATPLPPAEDDYLPAYSEHLNSAVCS